MQDDAVPGSACHEGAAMSVINDISVIPPFADAKMRVLSAHKNMRGIAGIECEDVNLRIAGRITNS